MLLPFSVRFDFLLVIILCGIFGIMAQSGSSDVAAEEIFGADVVTEDPIYGADVTEDPIFEPYYDADGRRVFGGELIPF